MIVAQTSALGLHNASSSLKKIMLPNPTFELHNHFTRSRQNVEAYIADQFSREYGAKIDAFLPQLLTMRCRSGFSAAVGLRQAENDVLFLEQYLSQSIEQAITDMAQIDVKREDIIEIGNLVATQRGASHLLFILIAAMMNKAQKQWMVFTATGQVAKILRKFKFDTLTLCHADAEKMNTIHYCLEAGLPLPITRRNNRQCGIVE